MEKQNVNSAIIAAVGYDTDTQTLEIEFKKGGTYEYYEVPTYVYTKFMDAQSMGSYFLKMIKNIYKFKKLL